MTGSSSRLAQPSAAARTLRPRAENLGNQAMLRRLTPTAPHLQAKLTIGAVNDPLEAEADRAAEHVMRMSGSDLSSSPNAETVHRKGVNSEEEDKKNVHTKNNGNAPSVGGAPPIVDQVLKSAGEPLGGATRAFFEPRFGADFSNVRVHSDQTAAQSAGSINALAYAAGNHVVLGSGGSIGPNSLMAHELAHIVQQGEAQTVRRAGDPDPKPAASAVETGDPVFTEGPTFRFVVNTVKWVGSADAALIKSVQDLPPDSKIQIDGYASIEGPETVNAKLSADRALAAKSVLLAAKIPESRIVRLVAHGATEGKVEDRRSVVVRALDAPAQQAAPPPQGAAPGPGQAPGAVQQQPGAQGATLPPPLAPRKDVLEPGAAPADPATMANRQEVVKALTDFLNRAQTAQGKQAVTVTPAVERGIRRLFRDNEGQAKITDLLHDTKMPLPGKPADLAAKVAGMLPDAIPRSVLKGLETLPAADTPDDSATSIGDAIGKGLVDTVVKPLMKQMNVPADVQKTITDGLRDATGDLLGVLFDAAATNSQMDDKTKNAIHNAIVAAAKTKVKNPPDPRQTPQGDPGAPDPPAKAQDVSVPEPNRHDVNLPAVPVSPPVAKDAPKPNVPQPPPAADKPTVDSIIQALDDTSFTPAAAKGTEKALNYDNAKEVARSIANMLAAKDKEKSLSTVRVTLSASLKGADDLGEIYGRVADLVKKIADALPGGAAKVADVIIARAASGNEIPMQKIVHLH